ncbi:hypothetical protein B4N89_20510 [Embleya scabrispora]|uniref:Uncharacterized protein n=1 Tax=Embleya scabrispora TaxID=159449 RepID=A0A1T3P1N9_9ACTN|nr:hypothetical protein [Embleya scabrispora]OPC82998.1 hypothetical protein B4N89_20510 [Embleya scabrispora]
MPYPLQRQDAADWIAGQTAAAGRLFTDANSGPAHRPASGMYPARVADYLSTTAGSFESLWAGYLLNDGPLLDIGGVVATETGTTAEARVLINSVQFGPTVSVAAFSAVTWSPPVAAHGVSVSALVVEVQARRVSGTGLVRVGMRYCRLLLAAN